MTSLRAVLTKSLSELRERQKALQEYVQEELDALDDDVASLEAVLEDAGMLDGYDEYLDEDDNDDKEDS
jgi:hypothetical protein